MVEPMSARSYEVLWSPYDQTWHVFLLDQFVQPTGLLIVAWCGHSIPRHLVGDAPPDSICPPCSRVLGMRSPDVPLRMAG